jgi:2-polyprenyl-6-methoxyphenol hydroxylase-like FAD-dependent oxidoreductase
MVDAERILIVGGGIAGLCLATALHQQSSRQSLLSGAAPGLRSVQGLRCSPTACACWPLSAWAKR